MTLRRQNRVAAASVARMAGLSALARRAKAESDIRDCPVVRPRISPRSCPTRRLTAQDVRQGRQQSVDLAVGADGDPQIIGNARRGKMTDDHGALAQRGGERSARMRAMAREDEVAGGR